MNKNRFFTKPVVFGIAILLVIAVGVAAILVINQKIPADTIEKRLQEMGVPVIQVTSPEGKLYKVEIALQSASDADNLTLDDSWNMLLADRAARLAYRYGPRISSYKLVVYNTKGEVISSGETFVNPGEQSQNLAPPKKSAVDNETTKEILLDELKLGELTVDKIEVLDEKPAISRGQVLFMQVSAPDLETMNGSIKSFIASYVYVLETINKRYGTNIVLSHLKVVLNGRPIIVFVKDLEISSTRAQAKEKGLVDDWWPYSAGPVLPQQESPTSEPYPFPPPYATP